VKQRREAKEIKKARNIKYAAWLNLPEDQWTEARKAANTTKE
jgi:hypothetical protein